MKITRLSAYSPSVLASFDTLMHELSPSSYCDEEKLARVLSDSNSIVLTAAEDEQIVGTATLCIAHTPEFTLGFVEAVVVLHEYRGRHIGRMLMERVIEDARHYGVQHLHLTSSPKRSVANELYVSLGFQKKETNVYVMNLI